MALYKDWFGPLRGAPAFTVIEIPDGWGSQADVTSILQAAAAFRDVAQLHELYHEVSHLWNVTALERPYCRWNEGLATFLEDLAQEKLEGTPLVDKRAERLAQWLVERGGKDPRLKTVAMVDYGKQDMTSYAYSVGGLIFYALYRLVGQDRFSAAIGDYYQTYDATGGTTDQFAAHASTATGRDLSAFFNDWLYSARWYEILASGTKAQDLANRYRETPAEK